MKDFEALKNIWHNQVALPKVSHEDVLKRIRKTKNGFANKLLIELIGMTAAITLLIFIWFTNPFKMWTTHLGMLILIFCCLYYLYVQIRDYNLIKDESLLLNKPEEYIEYLKKYKHDRYLLNTRKYRVYTFFLSIGLALYFIEIAFLASVWITVLAIVFTVAWILFCYLVLMKNYIRKEESKLGDMIENLGRLQKQFEDQEVK
jgi:predicted membrane protein